MNMDFGTNKTPIEVIKEGVFVQTYFRDIYFGVNGKWHRKSWKEFNELKTLTSDIIAHIIMTLTSINKVKNAEHR